MNKKLKLSRLFFSLILVGFMTVAQKNAKAQSKKDIISLAGTWHFKMDPNHLGIKQKWFDRKLSGSVHLPGSMVQNNKGYIPTLHTDWTGSIRDSSWYHNPRMTKYRKSGHLMFPFFLTPVKHYVGAAWYQKTVNIPVNWKKKRIVLFLERAHWQTQVWVDNQKIGMRNSLSAPQVYNLTNVLTPGRHTLTIRVDNSIKDVGINVGPDSNSLSDQTQGNWNGIIGKIQIRAESNVWLENVQIYPDLKNKMAKVKVTVKKNFPQNYKGQITLGAHSFNTYKRQAIKSQTTSFLLSGKDTTLVIDYPMGDHFLTWSEFHPYLYKMTTSLTADHNQMDMKRVTFGMRSFTIDGTRFAVNGKPTFIRGTVNDCSFPLTGYPPMTQAGWIRIFKIAKSYGLNSMRFHSWCPPEAAFKAADKVGFYLYVEGPSWANHGTGLGLGRPIDKYLYQESDRIDKYYGNYPSFCMMSYGNEPAGHYVKYLNKFVNYWKDKDSRHVYTGAAIGMHWHIIPNSQFLVRSGPRGLPWSKRRPGTMFDHYSAIQNTHKPYLAHEVGQYCAFPDFKEIKDYTGVHQARNFELFKQDLKDHHMADEAHKFLMASGKLQVLAYKGEIEAALRTKGFAGFFLLSLNDYPGQGTALVGVLNAFWKNKGYVTPKEFKRFCNTVVPLARIPKFVYNNDEIFKADLEIANFSPGPLKNAHPVWQITNTSGKVIAHGNLPRKTIPRGNDISLGKVELPLHNLKKAVHLKLQVSIQNTSFVNSWNFWVYPDKQINEKTSGIYFCHTLNPKAEKVLKNGGKVFLLAAGNVQKGKHVSMRFLPVFWNSSWFRMRPPNTLGIYVQSKSPAFKYFPTSYHSNFQWWSMVNRRQTMWLQDFPAHFRPLVQPIDTWFQNRRLALIFEANVDGGKLMVSSADLSTDLQHRPAARQLLYSLTKYMKSKDFKPKYTVKLKTIQDLFKKQQPSPYNKYFD